MEFQRPSVEVMVVNVSFSWAESLGMSRDCESLAVKCLSANVTYVQVSFMNTKSTPLTDFNSIPVQSNRVTPVPVRVMICHAKAAPMRAPRECLLSLWARLGH